MSKFRIKELNKINQDNKQSTPFQLSKDLITFV